MFPLVIAEGRSLIRKRDVIEARAVELLSELKDYQLLTTILGDRSDQRDDAPRRSR